jgi:hypothetical protein
MPYLVYKKKYSYIIAILLALLIMMVVKFELTYYFWDIRDRRPSKY